MPKILINDIGYITGNNRTPIISKVKYWQKNNCEITIFCTNEAKASYEKNLSQTILAASSNDFLILDH